MAALEQSRPSQSGLAADTATDVSTHRMLPRRSEVELTIHHDKHKNRHDDNKDHVHVHEMTAEQKDNLIRKLLDPHDEIDFQVLKDLEDVQLAQLIDAFEVKDIPTIIQKFRKVTMSRVSKLKKDLTFRNISYRKGEVTYLSGVSGYVKATRMTCVLGAPDAGVTTLLKTLAGRASREAVVSGEILLGGQHLDEAYGQHVGFIPKDDLHYPTLTVRETLRMSVRMRYGFVEDIYKKYLVEVIIKFLGIGGNIANTIIGDDTHRGISGGQKRRVSIATEIVAGHNIVLADLLTNGLDSKTAYDLTYQMQTVVKTSPEGKAFMISLVQPAPELLDLFDDLLVMSKGRCVYFGPLKGQDGRYLVLDFLGELGFVRPIGKSLPDYLAEISSNPVKFHKSRVPKYMVDNGTYQLLGVKEEEKGDKKNAKTNGTDDSKFILIQKHAKTIRQLQDALEKTSYSHSLMPIAEEGEEEGEVHLKIGEAKDRPNVSLQLRGMALPNACTPITTESGRAVETESSRQLHRYEVKDNEREVGYLYLIKSYKESAPYRKLGEELWLEFEERMPWEITSTIPRFTTSWFYQTFECLKREWIVQMRDRATILSEIFQSALVAIILGTVFLNLDTSQGDAQARVGLLFIILLQQIFGPQKDVPKIMAKKRVYYSQEAAGYYHGSAFFVAQTLIQIPFAIINIFIFVIIIYPLTDLNGGTGSEEFWYMFGLILMSVLTAQAYILFICSITPNAVAAQAAVPVGLVLFMITCGYLISTDDIPVYWRWLNTISFITYGFRGLMLNEFNGLALTCNDDELVPPTSESDFNIAPPNGFGGQQTCPFTSGRAYLATFDMDHFDPDEEKNQVLFYMIAFITVFNALAFWGLVLRPHELGDQEEPPRFEPESKTKRKIRTEDMKKDDMKKDVGINPGGGAVDNEHLTLIKSKIVSYIEWKNLTYKVVNQKDKSQQITLLNDVAGYAKPGDMVALMGPSGAGKSTLLDVIAGKKSTGEISGDILVNGKPVDEFFPRIAGYVEQFDSHVELATVEESVYFSARLRLETNDEEEIKREVDNTMDAVGITHVKDMIIGNLDTGGISPELRKKTAIAVELVARPTILFLDEPTTGLDSVSAMAVIDTVSELADRGLAVICTIHQPSAELFSRFKRILILQPFRTGKTRGGRVAYFGDVKNVRDYCHDMKLGELKSGRNIADFALEALGGPRETKDVDEKSKLLQPADVFLETKMWQKTKALLDEGVFNSEERLVEDGLKVPTFTSVFAKGPMEQFGTVMSRTFATTVRDTDTISSQFGSIIIMGFVFGTLFYQLDTDQSGAENRVSIFFLSLMFISFTSSYKVQLLVKARASFFRETTSNMYRG